MPWTCYRRSTMWWGPIWIIWSSEPTWRELRNSDFRRHSTSGKRSPQRLPQRKRSKTSFATVVTGHLCEAVWSACIRWMDGPQHIGRIEKLAQPLFSNCITIHPLVLPPEESSKLSWCYIWSQSWFIRYICPHNALKFLSPISAVCDIPCLQYWRQISAAFPKAR